MKDVNDNSRPVTWLPPTKLVTTCDTNMQYFPFDTQTCGIKIGSWGCIRLENLNYKFQTHSKEEINMKHRAPFEDNPMKGEIVFDPAMYTASSEWEMISARMFITNLELLVLDKL